MHTHIQLLSDNVIEFYTMHVCLLDKCIFLFDTWFLPATPGGCPQLQQILVKT